MPYEIARRMSIRVLIALALAGPGVTPALAQSRVGIAILPPQPVFTPPSATVPPPVVPAYPPQVAAPLPPPVIPPQVTYFTPPQAVPVIIPSPAHGR